MSPIDHARMMHALSALKNQGAQDFADALKTVLSGVTSQLAGAADAGNAPQGDGEGIARTYCEITLTSKDAINQVYLDAAENYSVKGYNARLQNSFGHIYLGLDKGAEYDQLSTKPNNAIGRITTQEAFDLTIGIARLSDQAMRI